MMQLALICNELQKKELFGNDDPGKLQIIRLEDPGQLKEFQQASAVMDLKFEFDIRRIQVLQNFPGLVIINSVEHTLEQLNPSFVRINAWPTFLASQVIEASATNEDVKQKATEIFRLLNKELQWLPDEPGFIRPRVISMIINEAFLAFGEGVSSMQDVDTAMKLGTNYPYGPFEWAEKIGTGRIYNLLKILSTENPRYSPSSLITQSGTAS